MAKKPADDLFEQSSMSFGEHLEELRKALLKAFVWLGIGTLVGLYFAEDVVLYLQRPLEKAMYEFRVEQSKKAFKQANGVDAPEELAALLSELGVTPQISYVDPAVFQDSYDHGELKKAAKDDASSLSEEKSDKLPTDKPPTEKKAPPAESATLAGSPAEAQEKDNDGTQGAGASNTQEVNNAGSESEASPREGTDETASGEAPSTSDTDSVAPEIATDAKTDTNATDAGKLSKSGLATADDKGENGEDETGKADEAKETASILEELADPWTGLNAESLRRLRPVIIWQPNETRLVSLQATEGFMIWLKAGLVAGVVIGSPGIFWHIWQFFAAGLYPHERRYVYWYLPLSLGLFFSGVALAFFVMLKIVLGFLTGYTTGLGVDFTPRLTDYVSFALFLPLGFGIAFQLPLVMLGLHRFGVISVELFISQWRIAILAIAFLSMILTPSDPYTMVGLAAPLSVLYFFGIFLCKYMPRGDGFGSQALDPTS